MEKMKSKKLICNFCGGEFEDMLPQCPYCGSFNYKGAEAEYLDKLEDIREDVEQLGEVLEAETRKEFYKQGKFLKRLFIVLGCIVAFFLLFAFWVNHGEKRDAQADYLWKKENFPIMDELYAQEKYEELTAFYWEATVEDYPVYEWEHSEFCWTMMDVDSVYFILEDEQKGAELSETNYVSLLYYGWKIKGLKADSFLSEEDLERLQPYIQPILEDFETRWEFTEEELNAFEKDKADNYGHVSFDLCEKYIKKWMKGREK
ncbi:MAG: hypothetical protein E7291_05700 [Lachnospiraceae bacterium]|nr:hypothetical protein [Lachnospiraceae bacterium]